MKKLLLLSALLLVLLLCVTACTKDNTSIADTSDTDATTTVTEEQSSTETTAPEESSVETTVIEESSVETTVIEESSVETTVIEESSVETTAIEESSVETTVIEESSVETTAHEESSVETTAPEESSVVTTVIEESSVEETTTEDESIEEIPTEESSIEETSPEEDSIEETQSEDNSSEEIPTEEDSSENVTSEEESSEETTEEETTEEVTTSAPKYNFTMWNRKKDVVKHLSFDQLWEGSSNSGNNIFTPGKASAWNGVADLSISSAKALTFYGWVAVKGELGMFGYSIDSGRPIFNEDWDFEDASLTPHFANMGGDTGCRMKIVIDLSELKGTHKITTLYRSGAGKIVALYTFEVIIADLEDIELPVVTPTTTPTLPDAYGENTADVTYVGDDDYVLYTYKDKTALDFASACSYYTDNGYSVYTSNEKAGNLFTTLTNGTAMAHIYWFEALGELNIVVSSTAAHYLPPQTPEAVDGEFECTVTQLEDFSNINGMSYVIQLKDGSFILYDGAYSSQAELLLNYLKENYKGEGKPLIRAWVLTHAHSDHYPTFLTIARKWADEINVEYVIATPLNDEVFELDDEEIYFSTDLKYDVARLGAKLVYAHTGMEFTFCNLNMEVLLSPDDIYKNVTNTTIANRDVNFNNTSVVTRLYDSEYKALFNGDIGQRGTDIMEKVYGDYLKSDMCQAAHHGVEDVPFSYYDIVKAQIVFYPCDYNLYDNNTRHIMVRLKLELMDYTKEILIQGLSRYTRDWGTKYDSDAPLSIPDYTPSANRPVYDGSLG